MPQGVPANLDILRRTTRADWKSELDVRQQESIYPQVAMDLDSDSDQEVIAFFGSIPKPRRTSGVTGAPLSFETLNDFGFTIINAEWTGGVEIEKSIVEDAKLNMISNRARQQAESAVSFTDETFAALVETPGNGFDGQAMFGATHEGFTDDPHDNDITSAAVDPENPTNAEVENAVDAAYTRLQILQDDHQRIANAGELGLKLMTPAKYWRQFNSILNVGPVAGQTGNTGSFKGLASVLTNPYLTIANDFVFLMVTARILKPWVFQKRIDWEFNFLTSGDKWDRENKATMTSRARHQFAPGDWKKIIRLQFV